VGTVSNPLTWLRQRFGSTRRATSQRATASNQALDEQMLDLREQLGATVDGIVQANATTGTPWAPHLLAAHGQGVDPHWVTVEEWVGDTERITADGIAVREGGVLVLRVCAWPRVDENGRLRLVGEAWAVRVRAAAFGVLVRELIGVQARPPRVGSVYLGAGHGLRTPTRHSTRQSCSRRCPIAWWTSPPRPGRRFGRCCRRPRSSRISDLRSRRASVAGWHDRDHGH